MTDKELENMETVDITVTQESMDAHVQCLKKNGYAVRKRFNFTTLSLWIMFYTLGLYTMAVLLKW